MSQAISPYAWTRRFDEPDDFYGGTLKIDLKLAIKMLPALLRINKAVRETRKQNLEPVLNPLAGFKTAPVMGVPLGGLGGGTITRGWRGGFLRWQMRPGRFSRGEVLADQFHVRVQHPGEPFHAVTLSASRPAAETLGAWNWQMDPSCATYHALFPRAWTVYEEPVPGVRLTCRQISPFIPHNYRESSFPVAVFVWDVENISGQDETVSLMFTFQNGIGEPNDLAGGHSNHLVSIETDSGTLTGVELQHVVRHPKPLEMDQPPTAQSTWQDPLTFAVALAPQPGQQVSYRTRFITNSSGIDVWDDFTSDGRLDDDADSRPAPQGFSIGAALCAKVEIPAGAVQKITFALSWDMPVARFGLGSAWYRRYTRFYGTTGEAAAQIAADALLYYPVWEQQIDAWQQPILADPDLPDWYKSMLFNETYYLVDGGTIWTAGKADGASTRTDPIPEPEIGHFAYLESHEYPMYNTFDVHFYSSFALAMLFPQLELALQRDFAHSIQMEHPEQVTFFLSGAKGARKVKGAIPHDLGAPMEDPWYKVNAYAAQDISRWKDLNPKFVLQVYRDYLASSDTQFLTDLWQPVRQAIDFMYQYDRDGDGLIENDGYPDQTYDVWTVKGASAYTGGLWLACLAAGEAIARKLNHLQEAEKYARTLVQAAKAYEDLLWNGEYYNYDSSGSAHHDSIMADQLAGQWYARACNLPALHPPEHIRSALKKIHQFNVLQFKEGMCGAVNGMRPDGSVDRSDMQASEMWVGTTFAVAACMLQEELPELAFATTKGIHQAIYQDYGLFFQTPEAISLNDSWRATSYMRPLAVWAMQWAWERQKRQA